MRRAWPLLPRLAALLLIALLTGCRAPAPLTPPDPPAAVSVQEGAPAQAPPLIQAPIPAAPASLRIPVLNVDVPLRPLSRAPDGAMGAPENGDEAGWDAPGPVPGSPGNALIAAHRDLRGRLGPFWRLEHLRPGDLVEVKLKDGARVPYTVAWVRSYHVDRAPLDEIFAPSPFPALTLITCGGAFDRSRYGYLERVVVRARPVPTNLSGGDHG